MSESERLHAFERFYRGDQRGEIDRNAVWAWRLQSARSSAPAATSRSTARPVTARPLRSRSSVHRRNFSARAGVLYNPGDVCCRRSAAATASLLVLLAALTPSAPAQSDSGEIDIVVVDATTKQPLELARVLLDGPVMTTELTGKNGKVVFTDVPDGIYRARIVKRGLPEPYVGIVRGARRPNRDGELRVGVGKRRPKSYRSSDGQCVGDHLVHEHRPELAAAAALDRSRRCAQ